MPERQRPQFRFTLLRPGRPLLELTPRSQTLRFTTAAVGGFGSCSFSLPGNPVYWRREIPYLSTLVVTYGPTVVYEGRVEDIGLRWSRNQLSATVLAMGKKTLLDSASVRRIWSKRDWRWDEVPGNTLGSYNLTPDLFKLARGTLDVDDLTLAGVDVRGQGDAVANNDGRFAYILAPDGMTFTRLMGTATFANPAGNFRGKIRDQGGDLATISVSGAINQVLTNSTRVDLGGVAIGAVTLTDADLVQFTDLRLLGTSLTEDASGGFYGGTILRDLIALVSGLSAGVVEDGSDFTIQEIERAIRTKASSVVDEVSSYYEREWRVWEDGRFDWVAVSREGPPWLVTLADLSELDLDGTVDGMTHTTYLLYRDAADGRDKEASAEATDQRNPFVKTGQSRDELVRASGPFTASEASQLASRDVEERGAHPRAAGTIEIPAERLIRRSNAGPMPALMIRAGDSIAVTDLPRIDALDGPDGETVFRIASTSVDLSEDSVTLELETFGRRLDVQLARLAAATR